MANLSAAVGDPLGDAIVHLRRRVPNPFFLQIGGFDGESFDPLRASIIAHDLAGLIVEPIPQYFKKLETLYAGSETVLTANYAVAAENGTRPLWRFNPEAVARGMLPPHFAGISSFLMEDLLSESGVLGRSSPNAETTSVLRKLVQAVDVQCRTLDTLLREFGITRIDILQIDTEGYDFEILKLFDFARYRPAVVQYEHQHLNPMDMARATQLLRDQGYRLIVQQFDTLAILEKPAPSVDIFAVRAQAETLIANGKPGEALPLLEHLDGLVPRNPDILRLLARAQDADGRILEAMATLARLQALGDDVAPQAHPLKLRAFARHNEHLQANQYQQAERYAAGLAALWPDHVQIQDSAFRINRVLGRKVRTTDYAIAAHTLDPGNREAWGYLIDLRRAPTTAAIEIDRRIALAMTPRSGLHPLYLLRNLHSAATAILSEPLTRPRIAELEHILKLAMSLTVPVEPGSKGHLWERFYRLIVGGIDLAAVLAPTPTREEKSLYVVTSGGTPLTWSDVRDVAHHRGVQVVFFAAGDEAYVQKFARWYALSVLKHSDVPCLVIVHVIGAGERLPAIARSLNVPDDGLILTGDDFDPAAVQTICYDSPNYGIHAKPMAHFQSMRFQRLAALLAHLDVPVCVSDIDMILQRGIADLLDAHAAHDVVLNANIAGFSAADRITANLLLVRPSVAGQRFARFVGNYLDRVLSEPEVMRWIDQLALLLGRHHLQQAGEGSIGIFDPDSDINNVIYPAYRANPYRFLSLYVGFDMASLEGVLDS